MASSYQEVAGLKINTSDTNHVGDYALIVVGWLTSYPSITSLTPVTMTLSLKNCALTGVVLPFVDDDNIVKIEPIGQETEVEFEEFVATGV